METHHSALGRKQNSSKKFYFFSNSSLGISLQVPESHKKIGLVDAFRF
jgi:hypothetical protein